MVQVLLEVQESGGPRGPSPRRRSGAEKTEDFAGKLVPIASSRNRRRLLLRSLIFLCVSAPPRQDLGAGPMQNVAGALKKRLTAYRFSLLVFVAIFCTVACRCWPLSPLCFSEPLPFL